ncbi:MAG: fluoride efflux transporter CrcB [Chloroflexota bacterium]|nr:fluoride efflux transporter CrcB [Dehalococcoidia bacterium]MDW8046650.1 fluoride efflux transporter CrcB [Chloroflexota bacterium]
MIYAYIVAGAVLGAPARYFLQGKVQQLAGPGFPWGTLVVNVTGCLVIGFIATLAFERELLSREARAFLMVGFLGSYTTFSSFGWETFELARELDVTGAAANIVGSILLGLVGVWLGSAIARLV